MLRRSIKPRRTISFSVDSEGGPVSASGLEDQSVTVWFSGVIGGEGTQPELVDEIREAFALLACVQSRLILG